MAKRSIVPFGPQHPVLPEPIHLDLVLEDETVVGADMSTGDWRRWSKRKILNNMYISQRESAASAAADMDWVTAWQWKMSWALRCRSARSICG